MTNGQSDQTSETGVLQANVPFPVKGSLTEAFVQHAGYISDKWEQYLPIYDSVLTDLRSTGEPIHLLEIGVQNGGSLQIWSKVLPPGSTIVGLDIDPKCAELEMPDNVTVKIVDASDRDAVNEVLRGLTFDVIIDDGSHVSSDIIATFEACFGLLKAGGIYLVEDIHCSYFKSHGGGFQKHDAAIEYFKRLIDAVHADYFEPGDTIDPRQSEKFALVRDEIAQVSFFDSVVWLRKIGFAKATPFRRVMGGSQATVADVASNLSMLPVDQLRTLLLSDSAFASFAPKLIQELAATSKELGRTVEMHLAGYQTIAALNADLSVANQKIAAFDADVSAANQKIAAFDADLSVANQKNAALNADVSAANQKNAALDADVSAANQKIAALDADVSVANQKIAALDADLSAANQKIAALKADVSVANQKNAALDADVSAANQKIAALNLDLSAANQTHDDEVARITSGDARWLASEAELKHRLFQADDRVRVLENSLAQVYASTLWQASRPVMRVAGALPVSWRRNIRNVLKVVRWAATGQLFSRLKARRTFRAGLMAPSPAPVAQLSSGGHSDELSSSEPAPYEGWLHRHQIDVPTAKLQPRLSLALAIQPKFSVLVPVFRTPVDVFSEMVESVVRQTYPDWELCIALVDEGELTSALLRKALEFQRNDTRIRVNRMTENLGISGNSNAGLAMAAGDWVVLLDHDDLLSNDALFEMAKAISADPSAGFIYSDKDSVDRSGTKHFNPLLKPEWSPEIMLNANYLTHLCAMRTQSLRDIGGWDRETDGAQDWDIFLRVIAHGGTVVHVPRVLYHWRWIETSVAAGGFDAKPYAAAGQLKALSKYLPVAGWPDATPSFDGPTIRIDWGKAWRPKITIVSVGATTADQTHLKELGGDIQVIDVTGREVASAVDDAIRRARGEIIVVLDAAFAPSGPTWLRDMVGPLANEKIGVVGGLVLDDRECVVDYGVLIEKGIPYPAFRGEPAHYYAVTGGPGWYRNASAVAGGAIAFRRAQWSEVGGFRAAGDSSRPDLVFTSEIVNRGLGRILLNPFARFITRNGPSAWERASTSIEPIAIFSARRDPFLNPNLTVEAFKGTPQLKFMPSHPRQPSHDFAAEASWVAQAYDVTSNEIAASRTSCERSAPVQLKTVTWFIPNFEVAFYGGINTILRAANHMQQKYGVTPVFAVLGAPSSAIISSRIAQAFPKLAAAKVVKLDSVTEPKALDNTDAAVCTLWVTAFPLLKMKNARKKFYFVQDWEPLFYPAGTISSMVEATYRFGFHGVCNTPALAESYKALGGRADFFMPSVDPKVFHAERRPKRPKGAPFVLICYGRPGTPRNCFESLVVALTALKIKYGEKIDIITAGAEWNPADYGLGGVLRNLGLLPYAETGVLYRSVDAGLVAMATRHPSYLPFEWMACGAAVVTNRNAYTGWMLRHEENCLLCELTSSDIVENVSRLIDDPALRDGLASRALAQITESHSSWDATCDKIYETMKDSVGG